MVQIITPLYSTIGPNVTKVQCEFFRNRRIYSYKLVRKTKKTSVTLPLSRNKRETQGRYSYEP